MNGQCVSYQTNPNYGNIYFATKARLVASQVIKDYITMELDLTVSAGTNVGQ